MNFTRVSILAVLMLLSLSAFGQEPAVIEAVKVAFVASEEETPADVAFRGLLMDRLKYLTAAQSSERADLDIAIVVTPITAGEGTVIGYAAAVAVIAPEGKTRDRVKLWNDTGPSLEGIAQRLAPKMDKFFKERFKRR